MKSPNHPITQSPNGPSIVFFGSSSYVIPIIKVLQKNFTLSLVITTEKKLTDAIPSYCIKNRISYLSFSNLSNSAINHELSTIDPVAGVLADFGLLIPKEILNAFPMGIINIHPSLLPKYRGPTPVQTAILNGEKVTGVSIMKLDEKIDHGPILNQEKEEISDTDTADSLYKRLFEMGANLLPKTLDKYLKGKLMPQAQNHTKATLTKPLTRQDGFINILKIKDQKSKIARMVRAYYPWPGVWFKTKLNGKDKIVKLLPNCPTAQKPNSPIAQCPNDPFLIQVEGKKPMSCQDFLNGYPDVKGVILPILQISK